MCWPRSQLTKVSTLLKYFSKFKWVFLSLNNVGLCSGYESGKSWAWCIFCWIRIERKRIVHGTLPMHSPISKICWSVLFLLSDVTHQILLNWLHRYIDVVLLFYVHMNMKPVWTWYLSEMLWFVFYAGEKIIMTQLDVD